MILIKKNYHKIITNWLLGTITLIFLMIVIGGLTRLTNSGLSITEWELFAGVLPPFSYNEWSQYFELYKKIPQYKLVNPNMTLSEFKIIFYWEYLHRILGRLTGLFFLLPLIYFTFKKAIEMKSLIKMYLVFFLIVLQGLIGWYMVKSGLVNDVTVSHYRLSLHLSMAFIILSILYWNYINLTNNTKKIFFIGENKILKYLFFFVILQIIFGAFVSGLDAGKIYQTWPKMNLSYFPDDINIVNLNIYSIFNQQSLVQFMHRSMAYIIIFLVLVFGIRFLKHSNRTNFKSYITLLLVLLFQIILGISALLSDLNIIVASLHQITSIILVFTVLNLNYKFS